LRNTKADLEELGEDMTESKYAELIDTLTGHDVQIMDESGYRATYDILADLAKVWDELSSTEKAALETNIAGKRVPERTAMCA